MAWYKYAKPGDKVVCVDRSFRDSLSKIQFEPEFATGAILTIESIIIHPDFDDDIGLEFEGCYYQYNAIKFRPIQPKSTETGMKVFKGILNGQRVPEVA